MRMDFNIVIVDDDVEDDDNNGDLKEFISKLQEKIKDKGFVPKVNEFSNVEEAKKFVRDQNTSRRVDLYLSDNNLGESNDDRTVDKRNGGIVYYLDIKSSYICDFILYTRSAVDEIVEHLAGDLRERKDPNLFSRFTFVSRSEGGQAWYQTIFNVVDHILTKREEINNLRGLFAQKTAKMHNHLRSILKLKDDAKTFGEVIALAYEEKHIDVGLKSHLERLRDVRNGVIHNDEEFCNTHKNWFILYSHKGKNYKLYENEFKKFREHLMETEIKILGIQK